MNDITPRMIEVSPTARDTQLTSISDALAQTSPGDSVYVHPGTYTPETGESFPLFIPPGVSLIGAGREHCCIDGQGAMVVSTRPIQNSQSLVLLGDQSNISGLTITGSGGHGVSAMPLAHTEIYNNCIENNGQHGLFISSPNQVIVRNNLIRGNGTKQTIPMVPRGLKGAARQGHNILISAAAHSANQISVFDNVLQHAFADGIGLYADFDETNPVAIKAHIVGNQIENNQRFGAIIAGSFGSSYNQVTVELHNNTFQTNQAGAIEVDTSLALVNKLVRQSHVTVKIISNKFEHSSNGIFLSGGFGPAVENALEVLIAGNRLTDIENYAIRAIAGIGFGGCSACDNQLRLTLGNNKIERVGKAPILLQGAVAQHDEEAIRNRLWARIIHNEITQFNSSTPILINDGLSGENGVSLLESTLPHHRQKELIPL